MCSLNKVKPFKIYPDKSSINQARVTFYQRNYIAELEPMCNATQQQLRWFCDSFD